MISQKLFKPWNDFWFMPTSPSPVCAFRILYGLVSIFNGLLWCPDFVVWFGQNGVLPVETLKHAVTEPRLSVLTWFNPTDNLVMVSLLLYILASVCLTLGFCTRFSSFIVFVLAVSFYNRNPYYWHSVDGVLRNLGLTLIFAPAGMMYSVDSWLKHRAVKSQTQLVAPWAQRLLQFQLASLYWKAFWGKIIGETWQNGTAVYYASHLVLWNIMPVPSIFQNLWSIKAFTWGTLAIECSLWSLLWIRQIRYQVLLVGVIFHLIIDWDFNIDFLEIAVISCYVNFIEPGDLENVVNRLGNCAVLKIFRSKAGSCQVS